MVFNNRDGGTDVKPPGVETATADANVGTCTAALAGAAPSTPASPIAHTLRTTPKSFIKVHPQTRNAGTTGRLTLVIMAATAHPVTRI
jgi:hypothetical protein